MTENRILYKLATRLNLEMRFPSSPDTLQQTMVDSKETDRLLQMLQDGAVAPELEGEVHRLLSRYETGNIETQEWSVATLDRRFREYTPIPNSPAIEKSKLVEPINSGEERVEMAKYHGFRFEKYSTLLNEIGFWQRIGPMLEQLPVDQGGVKSGEIDWSRCNFSLDHPNFKSLMNALNGSAPINYEAAFREFQNKFDELKRQKYHLDDDTISQKKSEGKSPLSMPDLLGVVIIDKLNQEAGFNEEQKAEIEQINNAIVNDRIPDIERIELFKRLKEIYSNTPKSKFAEVAQDAIDEVNIPDDHPDKVQDLHQLKKTWSTVDAIPVLGSSDDGLNALKAANAMYEYPEAFMIPSGGLAPFQFRTDKQMSQTTEAQHMIAMVTNTDLQNTYPWRYPNAPDLSNTHRLQESDILSPDMGSMSTVTNASETTKRLLVLVHELAEKKINVLVATNDFHARRAKFDFEKQLAANGVKASVRILENKECPLLAKPVEERNPHAWQYILGEINKGLYTVATNNKVKPLQ